MTGGTARSRATHAALVKACIEAIQETGSFQPESVADRAGVSAATFYTHFANKDEALSEVVSEIVEVLNSLAESMLAPERLLDLGLHRVIEDFARASRDIYEDYSLVIRLAQTRINDSRAIGEVFIQRQREGLRILEKFVTRGQKAGLITVDDPTSAALTLMAVMQSINNRLVIADDDYLVNLTSMIVSFLN